MNSLYIIVNQVLVLYVMIIVGIIANKIKILNSDVNQKLSSFLLNLTLPMYIISSFDFEYSKSVLNNLLLVLIFGFIFHLFCFLIGLLIYHKYPKNIKGILIFALIFTNCGYVGFPILENLYGKLGVVYGSVFLIPFNVYLWTLGIVLFRNPNSIEKINIKKLIFNPGIIASIIGVLIFSFSIHLPVFIKVSFSSIGSMTSPLSMIIIGGIISEMKIKEVFKIRYVYFNSFLRLLIIPSIVYFSLIYTNIDNIVLGVCVILAAMPAAVTTPIFAQKYESDVNLASKLVFISTLLAIFSIPIILILLR